MESERYSRDIEESDETLDHDEPSPIEFWEKKQRELITSVVDYNLGTLADLVRTDEIALSPRYQRRFRWDEARQSRLIESFLMNVPVPPIFLNEDQYGQYSVIDGKQRLTAVSEFFRGRLRLSGLEVFSEINGQTVDDLPAALRTVLRTRPTLRAIIILRQSDQDVKFEVFQRLNTGGVRLNAQEIRNSTYPGPLNDMVLNLSVNKNFHDALGIRNQNKSAVYREMRDAEFVLRYFTFRDRWESFTGGMRRYMDEYMANNQRMPPHELESARDDFLRTLEVVRSYFGPHEFQRWSPEKAQWRKQVLASLYDAEMFACRGLDPNISHQQRAEIQSRFKALFAEEEFRRAIDAATNTPSYFKARIAAVRRTLLDVIR